MPKPTEQQIIDCDDEQQLNEWAAIYCMGWIRSKDDNPDPNIFVDRYTWSSFDGATGEYVDMYNPCKNGGQAFDLMVKFYVVIHWGCSYATSTNSPIIGFNGDLLKAITKASICSAITKGE